MSDLPPTTHRVSLYLNTALMQSPEKISKTRKAIDYIRHFSIISRAANPTEENGVHQMTLILTNNSLSETAQWKVRLLNKLGFLNPMILSSRQDSDMKNINQMFANMLGAKAADDLPDVIMMCTHERRTSDVVKIVKTLKRQNYDFRKIGIHKITLTIMFDEADKNIRLVVDCLKNIWPHLTNQEAREDNVIRDIHFITATPLKDFWKELERVEITKLSNINRAIQDMDESSVLHGDYAELMKSYVWLKSHVRDHSIGSMTKNPIEYAESVISTLNLRETPRILFVPATTERSSHYDMLHMLQRYGMWVYVDNGDKRTAKGFYDPRGNFEPVDRFRARHDITGEPYETFRVWKALHPNESLAITGWLTIIRGITFNTTGFNFTNMILSAVHMRNIADFLQVSGRANGDVKYVNPFTIHCPKTLWDTLDKQIRIMNELHEKNPEEFEERHFREPTNHEQMELGATIPCVFTATPEQYSTIKKSGVKWDIDSILRLIPENAKIPGTETNVKTEITRLERAGGRFKIQQPDPNKENTQTYPMLITRFMESARLREKNAFNVNKKDKYKDGYRIHLDQVGHNIIVNFYYGSKVPQGDSDSGDDLATPTG